MKTMRILLTTFMFAAIGSMSVYAQGVLVNQVGYLPDQQKHVYSVEGADSFYVVNSSSGDIAYRGAFTSTATKDPATGLSTSVGDFTPLTAGGRYQILTSNSDTSCSFDIAKTVFEDVYKASMKGFYFQRCGIALASENAGPYARSACHLSAAVFHSSTGESGTINAAGGWHDAGDYGRYVVNAGISVGTLLLAYEMFPAKFKYDNLNIPESGNSVPDILDEVKYELEWMLEMQDTSDGGVYFKATTANFPGFIMPSSDNSTMYIYQKSSTATGDFAAVMAMAGRIYVRFDSAFASKCLDAAAKAWSYLVSNPSIVPAGGFKNPAGTSTGEYGDGNDSDERLWAAAELFETTGEDTYSSYFKSHYTTPGVFTSTMGWPSVGDMAQISYLIGNQPGADAAITSALLSSLKSYCTSLVSISSNDGLNVSILPTAYNWGSNSGVLNNAVLLVVGYTLSGDTTFYNTALQQLNYILGCNRIDMTFVTGIGTRSPMNPHHRPSYADGITDPIPGLMAGGPDKGLDDAILQATYTSSTPPARCYVDNWQSYASNEIAINWNAPLVFVAGYMNESPATPVKGDMARLPETCKLEQNYPNPFNPSTVISFRLSSASDVTLKVYDVLGREVATLMNGRENPGYHSVTFNAVDLPSGVYFYRIRTENFSDVKKLMLVK